MQLKPTWTVYVRISMGAGGDKGNTKLTGLLSGRRGDVV